MSEQLDAAVEAAEELAAGGRYAAAGDRIAELATRLPEAGRPDLLARAAWVAAISALAGGRLDEWSTLTGIASGAAALVSDEARADLELVAHRISTLATIAAREDNLDAAVMLALRDHALLLLRLEATGDETLWSLVDAERADWPHLFAAVRERLGRPCRAEQYMRLAPTDPIGRVVLGVILGLGPYADISPDELAALCFREASAQREARKRIDAHVADRRLAIENGRVKLILPTR